MKLPACPAPLTAAAWSRHESALAGDKPTGLVDALKALAKAHAAIEPAALDAEVASLAEVAAARVRIEAQHDKRIKPAVAQARAVETLAERVAADGKKAKKPAAAVAAASALARAADGFAIDLTQLAASARTLLALREAELQAEAKKKPAGHAAEDDEATLAKQFKARTIAAMRTVKAARPGGKPMHFLLAVGKARCAVWLAPSVGASHKALLLKQLHGDSGIRFFKGECHFEDKCWSFVGDDVPTGLAKKLQKALFELTANRYRLRVRRTTGEIDEVEGDDEDERDTLPKGSADQRYADVQKRRAARLTQRFKTIEPGLKRLLAKGDGLAKSLKALVDQFAEQMQALRLRQAEATLVQLEENEWMAGGSRRGPVEAKAPKSEVQLAAEADALRLEIDDELDTAHDFIEACTEPVARARLQARLQVLQAQQAVAERERDAAARVQALDALAEAVARFSQEAGNASLAAFSRKAFEAAEAALTQSLNDAARLAKTLDEPALRTLLDKDAAALRQQHDWIRANLPDLQSQQLALDKLVPVGEALVQRGAAVRRANEWLRTQYRPAAEAARKAVAALGVRQAQETLQSEIDFAEGGKARLLADGDLALERSPLLPMLRRVQQLAATVAAAAPRVDRDLAHVAERLAAAGTGVPPLARQRFEALRHARATGWPGGETMDDLEAALRDFEGRLRLMVRVADALKPAAHAVA